MPRTRRACARPCERRDSRRCASASTSKAPRWWRSHERNAMPGGDPGRRSRHQVTAADRPDPEGAGGRERRAVHRSPAPAVAGQGRRAGRGLRWIPGRDDQGIRRQRRALRPPGRVLFRWPPTARHGGRDRASLAPAGRGVLRPVRRQLSAVRLPGGAARVREERQARAHDGLPERGSLGPEQCRVRGWAHPGLRQEAPDHGYASPGLWPRRLQPARLRRRLSRCAPRSGSALPVSPRTQRAGSLRGRSTLLRGRIVRRSRRDAPLPGGAFLLPQHEREMSFVQKYLAEAGQVVERLDPRAIDDVIDLLADTRTRGGRLFVLGVGGSAANASHAVNDFRKIAGIEAYAPTDNVSELTARTNDEGWSSVFEAWLRVSRLRSIDAVLALSVGGGDLENNVSPNLAHALRYARSSGARILGIVGRDGGFTAQVANACVIIPTVNPDHVTPHTEAFQAVIWHLLVSHPKLKVLPTKWESIR